MAGQARWGEVASPDGIRRPAAVGGGNLPQWEQAAQWDGAWVLDDVRALAGDVLCCLQDRCTRTRCCTVLCCALRSCLFEGVAGAPGPSQSSTYWQDTQPVLCFVLLFCSRPSMVVAGRLTTHA